MPGPLTGSHLAGAIVGQPIYIGSINATTTAKTNAEGSVPFAVAAPALSGKVLLIYNAGLIDIRVHPVELATGDVTNTPGAGYGPPLAAGAYFTIRMGSTYPWMSVITTSSTADVHFWELT